MSNAFVGRHPIYTQDVKTVAYELLFRSENRTEAQFSDGEYATAELLLNTFTEIGLEQIVGDLPAYINVTEEFLLEDYAYALPRERVVLEVLETVRPTEDVINALSRLRTKGYKLAIDDFVFSPELVPLVELAEIVKVDLPSISSADELASHVEFLRKHDVEILAEKVETHEQFAFCKQLDFDYFQGFFFCRPTIVAGRKLPHGRLALTRLMAKLQDESVSLQEVAEIFRTEPALSVRLLRYVNSAYCGLNQQIESIQHAVAIAGIHRIRVISCLAVLAQAAEEKPTELIRTILVRARMAELLADQMGRTRKGPYFLAGFLSAIDALLDITSGEAVQIFPISQEVEAALVSREGEMGAVLNCVLEYEKGNWNEVSCEPLTVSDIQRTYLQSIGWSNEVLGQVVE